MLRINQMMTKYGDPNKFAKPLYHIWENVPGETFVVFAIIHSTTNL